MYIYILAFWYNKQLIAVKWCDVAYNFSVFQRFKWYTAGQCVVTILFLPDT